MKNAAECGKFPSRRNRRKYLYPGKNASLAQKFKLNRCGNNFEGQGDGQNSI